MEQGLRHVAPFLTLPDVCRVAAAQRRLPSLLALTDLTLTTSDLQRLGDHLTLTQVHQLFARLVDPRKLRSINLTLDPFAPQRALLLTILRALTLCSCQAPSTASFSGYTSALTSLKIHVASTRPERTMIRRHVIFKGACEHDLVDEKRLYCVCIDWSDTCVHLSTTVERRTRLGPHRNWMCWLLKDDWYNVFRWFPQLQRLRIPLGYKSRDGLDRQTYAPVAEFMLPKLYIRNGPGMCHNLTMEELELVGASDYTLLSETTDCQHTACAVASLQLGCLSVSRRALGRFIRGLLVAQVRYDGTLVVKDLKRLSVYSSGWGVSGGGPAAVVDGLSGSSSYSSLSSLQRGPSSDDEGSQREPLEGTASSRETHCRLALAFSSLVSATADADKLCETCEEVMCRSARVRSYAPVIFKGCESLAIDVCSLIAQEDLPHSFPQLKNLACSFWVSGEGTDDDTRGHFTRRLLDLLAHHRSITSIQIRQNLPPPPAGGAAALSWSWRDAEHLVVVESEHPRANLATCEEVARAFEAATRGFDSLWVVFPVLSSPTDTQEKLVMLPFVDDYKQFLTPRVHFVLVATGNAALFH